MVPELFDAGIDLVRRMDDRFYKGTQTTNTMSVRDVIYVTRSVIPLLQKRGITGLTIGSNGADSPPQVPKLHRWVDDSTGTDIVVVCQSQSSCPLLSTRLHDMALRRITHTGMEDMGSATARFHQTALHCARNFVRTILGHRKTLPKWNSRWLQCGKNSLTPRY